MLICTYGITRFSQFRGLFTSFIKNFLTGFAAIGILVILAMIFISLICMDYHFVIHEAIIRYAIGMCIVGGLAYLATDGR